MANTSPSHKEKRSQKRKDRQDRKRQRQERRKERDLRAEGDPGEEPPEEVRPEPGDGGGDAVESRPEPSATPKRTRRKSLPGYMAKNAPRVCRWLRDFMYLFVKVDDAQIGFLDGIPRDRRDRLVQEYVDVSTFVQNVENMLSGNVQKPVIKENQEESEREDELSEYNSGECW